MTDDIAAAVMVLGALALGCAGALLFRWARVPGGRLAAAIAGGICVGILAGPGVLGRVMPAEYASWHTGGAPERQTLNDYDTETRAEIAALKEIRVSPEAVEEHAAQRASDRTPLAEELEAAERSRRDAYFGSALGLFAIGVVIALPGIVPVRKDSTAPRAGMVLLVALACAIGLNAAIRFALPPLPVWVYTALVVVLALIVPASTVRARMADGVLAIAVAAAVLGLTRTLANTAGTPITTGAAIVPLAGVVVALSFCALGVFARTQSWRKTRRALASCSVYACFPAAIAISTAMIDPHTLWADPLFWIVLLLSAGASSDVRGLVFSRLLAPGSGKPAYDFAERITNHGTGLLTCMLATLAFAGGLIPPGVCAALLVCGAICEMSAGVRRKIARALQDGTPIADAILPESMRDLQDEIDDRE